MLRILGVVCRLFRDVAGGLTILVLVGLLTACGASTSGLAPYHQLSTFRQDGLPTGPVHVPPPSVLAYLRTLDERPDYFAYLPNQEEREQLQREIDVLPPLLRRTFEERVVGIYFVSDFASSALTEWVADEDDTIYSFMILHPDVLRLSAGELMTRRDFTCFSNDSSETTLQIESNASALFYILAHEGTHAADYSFRITDYTDSGSREIQERALPDGGGFGNEYWEEYDRPFARFDFPGRDQISFYGFGSGPQMPLAEAPRVYAELAGRPFASMYGSQNRAEDIAELVALNHLVRQGYEYSVLVGNAGQEPQRYRPLDFPGVRARLPGLERFYE